MRKGFVAWDRKGFTNEELWQNNPQIADKIEKWGKRCVELDNGDIVMISRFPGRMNSYNYGNVIVFDKDGKWKRSNIVNWKEVTRADTHIDDMWLNDRNECEVKVRLVKYEDLDDEEEHDGWGHTGIRRTYTFILRLGMDENGNWGKLGTTKPELKKEERFLT